INGARHCGLCALPGSVQHHDPVPLCPLDTVEHRSSNGTSVRGGQSVITTCEICEIL
ncbi:unnamed protein product, partial [Staurois parvus]